MADTRYLKRRRQSWYFQLAVPSHHREAFGRATITASLKTRDLTVAQARRWPKLVEAQEVFAKLSGSKYHRAAETLDQHSLLEIDDCARDLYRADLARLEDDAKRGIRLLSEEKGDNHPHGREIKGLDAAAVDIWFCYEMSDFRPVAIPLTTFCEGRDIPIGSEHYRVVGYALLNARMCALDGRGRALKGEPSDEPSTFLRFEPIDPVTLKPLRAIGMKRNGLAFREVAARFIAERQRDPAFALTAQTKGQYEATFRLFDQWAKHPKLDEIDRTKASAFLDAISSLDPHWGRGSGVKALSFNELIERFASSGRRLSARTINRYAMALSMVWKYAEDRADYQGANPWTRQARPTTKRRGSSEIDKRAFTSEEIRKLLEPSRFVAPAHDVSSVLPWLILISAYSGMRLNEICELDVEGVKETGGILCFNLTVSKTDAGVRVVPLHSEIVKAGFIEYLDSVRKGSLWPALKPGGPDDKRSWYVSKRFTDYRRALGLIDIDKVTQRDRLDFHSLRRSAITALKHAGIAEHEVAEVVGHDHPRITYGGYADRQRLNRLKNVVEAIQYEC